MRFVKIFREVGHNGNDCCTRRYVRTVGLNTTPATPQEKQDKTLFFSVPRLRSLESCVLKCGGQRQTKSKIAIDFLVGESHRRERLRWRIVPLESVSR